MLNVKDTLDKFVLEMFTRGQSFYNKPLSRSLMKLTEVKGDALRGAVYVPFWWPVLQHGRGVRKSNTTTFDSRGLSEFAQALYAWMQKHNRFESKTEKGKINEAKSMAWYINKYGNKHFRSGRYIDIYDSLIKETVDQAGKDAAQLAMDIITKSEILDL